MPQGHSTTPELSQPTRVYLVGFELLSPCHSHLDTGHTTLTSMLLVLPWWIYSVIAVIAAMLKSDMVIRDRQQLHLRVPPQVPGLSYIRRSFVLRIFLFYLALSSVVALPWGVGKNTTKKGGIHEIDGESNHSGAPVLRNFMKCVRLRRVCSPHTGGAVRGTWMTPCDWYLVPRPHFAASEQGTATFVFDTLGTPSLYHMHCVLILALSWCRFGVHKKREAQELT